MLLGSESIVRKTVRALLRRAYAQHPATVDFGSWVDVQEVPAAQILLDQANRREPGEHIHSYMLFDELLGRAYQEFANAWFDWALKVPWALSGLLGSSGQRFFMSAWVAGNQERARRQAPYLQAVHDLIDEIDSAGPRYRILSDIDFASHLLLSVPCGILKDAGIEVPNPTAATLKAAIEQYLTSAG